jgi:hypothetical protein
MPSRAIVIISNLYFDESKKDERLVHRELSWPICLDDAALGSLTTCLVEAWTRTASHAGQFRKMIAIMMQKKLVSRLGSLVLHVFDESERKIRFRDVRQRQKGFQHRRAADLRAHQRASGLTFRAKMFAPE